MLGFQFYVSNLVRHNYSTRKGHLGSMFRIFGYLNHYMKPQIIYDTTLLENQGGADIEPNLLEIYSDSVE